MDNFTLYNGSTKQEIALYKQACAQHNEIKIELNGNPPLRVDQSKIKPPPLNLNKSHKIKKIDTVKNISEIEGISVIEKKEETQTIQSTSPVISSEKKEMNNTSIIKMYFEINLLKSSSYEEFLLKYMDRSRVIGIIPLNQEEQKLHDDLIKKRPITEKNQLKLKLIQEIEECFK